MAKLSHLLLLCLPSIVSAAALHTHRDVLSYAPTPVQCPSSSLTRSAKYIGDISAEEQCYFDSRKPIAQAALKSWFNKVEQDAKICFNINGELPIVGLAVSGGGDRSALTAAGVVQAWDSREKSQTSMSGLYQAFAYHSALSGGNELSGSLERLNWPTITELLHQLWYSTLTRPIAYPAGNMNNSKPIYQQIGRQLEEKHNAGFKVSLVDIIGRLYAFTYLGPPDGSSNFKMSDITLQSNFSAHKVPFPIHMTTDYTPYGFGCPQVRTNNSQFEMTPYEFGSWDPGVSAFSKMRYLGSMPQSKNLTCVVGFDRLGFLLATSGDAAGTTCQSEATIAGLENITDYRFDITQETFRSQFPNPFYCNDIAPGIENYEYLQLVDGGGAAMGISLWPLIHRPFIDVVFVNDNTNGTADGYPNGGRLYNTYTQAQIEGITTMPEIPPPKTFVQNGYNKRNVFFGCNNPASQSIVYLPNADYSYDSGAILTSLTKAQNISGINAAIANGNLIGTSNNAADWPVCVGCLILKKTNTTLPAQCQNCFAKYCVN